MKKYAIFILLIPQIVFAGAWLQDPGNTETYFQGFGYQSCNYADGSGNVSQSSCFSSISFNPSTEVGLTSFMSLGGGMFGQLASQSTNDYYGTNANIFTKFKLWHSDYSVLSAQITQYIPTGNNFSSGTLSNQSINVYQENLGTEARILYGVGGERWYVDLQGGIGQSLNGYGQIFTTQSAVGIKGEQQKWFTELKLLATYNTNDTQLPGVSQYDYYNLYTISPSFTYNINRSLGWSVGLYQDIFGNNVGLGTTVAASIIWRTR